MWANQEIGQDEDTGIYVLEFYVLFYVTFGVLLTIGSFFETGRIFVIFGLVVIFVGYNCLITCIRCMQFCGIEQNFCLRLYEI